MDPGAAQAVLMYFVLPVWLAAGFADYLCHRAASIETTSGWKESLLHLLQFAEMGIPTLAAIFLDINALIILVMIVCLIVHHATAIWDVSYAYRTREVTPTEQHVHSFLEMLPLMGLLIVATLHWQQFLSLFGLGQDTADFGLRLKQPPLPWLYVTIMLSLVLLFEVLPYLEELRRGLRQNTVERRKH
jgi:ABC-type spermidine/putrescine transport system permease subunit I